MTQKQVIIMNDHYYLSAGLKSLVEETLASVKIKLTLCSMSTIQNELHKIESNVSEKIVIMDICNNSDSMLESLNTITKIKETSKATHIIVVTEAVNPLVFLAIDNRKPSMLISQREPCSIISQLIGIVISEFYKPNTMTIYSPMAANILSFSRQIKLTPKALDYIVCQQDGLSMKETAKLMKIPYKSVSYLKCKANKANLI